MDYGRGLSFIRQDPNWLVKVLLGSVISLVPILNFAAYGYMLDVIRNVFAGRETPLPEWGENFGDRWVRGLIYAVIGFIYLLPIVVLGCLLAGVGGAFSAAGENSAQAGQAGAGVFLCLVPLIIVGALVLSLLAMIAQARYAVTNQFGEAMRFGAVLAEFREGLGRWFGVLGMMIVVSVVLVIVIMFTCGLGYLVAFYPTLALAHWLAQAMRQSRGSAELSTGYL